MNCCQLLRLIYVSVKARNAYFVYYAILMEANVMDQIKKEKQSW